MGVIRRFLDFLWGTQGSGSSPQVGAWTPVTPRSSSWFTENFSTTAVNVNEDTALNSGTALACTRAISETLASLPAFVMENVSDSERRKARDNPMWRLLHDQPNPDMDSMTWYEINATRVINRGNAVNLIEYNNRGEPIALWPVHNSRFEIFRMRSEQGRNGRFFPGDIFYRVWPDDTNRYFDIPRTEILNIVSWDTQDGLIGRGVVRRAKEEIGLDVAQQQFAESMFQNGALPLGLVKHPWLDDPEQREGLRADLNSLHSGRENWNKVGILWDKDADWVKLNFSPEDVQAIQSRTFTAKALCRYYNVPPGIVQIFDDYKFSTIEAMLKHFIMLTVRPYAIRFERAINCQLLRDVDESLFLEFGLEALLRGDPEAQARTNSIYRQAGVINADEIRQRDLNMNPLPDSLGQVVLAPLNQAPLEMIASGQNLRQSGGGSTGEIGEEVEGDDSSTQIKEYAERVLLASYSRMVANEVHAIRGRAQKGPEGFLQWLDAYYSKYESKLAESITIGCEGLTDDANGMAAEIAKNHVETSRELLLTACECSADEFEASIDRCINFHWNRKPIREVAA